MKYFLGGASGIRDFLMPEVASYIDYRLLSIHDSFKNNTKKWCEVSHHPKSAMKEVMLDSGAFTAFMRGYQTTLEQVTAAYDGVIKNINPKIHLWFINLDVIPGAIERKDKAGNVVQEAKFASPSELAEALEKSDDNFRYLRKRYGDRVLPVYHQTEGTKRLQHVMGMSQYIALGFRQDFSEEARIKNAQEVLFEVRLTHPEVRMHGLATTGYDMLCRAAFDTVDSASWLYCAAMGGILTDALTTAKDSRTPHLKQLIDLSISDRSPNRRIPKGHFENITPQEQEAVLARLEPLGITLEQLRTDLSYRILANAFQMREWMREYSAPRMVVEEGFFAL